MTGAYYDVGRNGYINLVMGPSSSMVPDVSWVPGDDRMHPIEDIFRGKDSYQRGSLDN